MRLVAWLLPVGVLVGLLLAVIWPRQNETPPDRAPVERAPLEEVREPLPVAAPLPKLPPVEKFELSGSVEGRYGGIHKILLFARRDGAVIASTKTDVSGTYRFRLPAGAVRLEVVPDSWMKLGAASRDVVLDADQREDFRLAHTGSASGRLVGAPKRLRVFAIPIDAFPRGDDGGDPSLGQLEAAPKRSATWIDDAFVVEALDPGVYRLSVDSSRWMLARTVTMRAGDDYVVLPVVRSLGFYVKATDIETWQPLDDFMATVFHTNGTTFTFRGRKGRVRKRVPVAEEEEGWKIRLSAAGFFDVECELTRNRRVMFQRRRAPNVVLNVGYDDGAPFTADLEGVFESQAIRGDRVDARIRRAGPGRYRATLPVGSWTLYLKREHALSETTRVLDLTVKPATTCEARLTYVHGGALEIRGGGWLSLVRLDDGWRTRVNVLDGTYLDLPFGMYEARHGNAVLGILVVTPGSRHPLWLPVDQPAAPAGG